MIFCEPNILHFDNGKLRNSPYYGLLKAHISTPGQGARQADMALTLSLRAFGCPFPWRECGAILPSISSPAQRPVVPKLRMSKLPVGSRDSLATMSSTGKEQHG